MIKSFHYLYVNQYINLALSYLGAPQECVEMGAQWVHGDEGNPLYAELAPLGLIDYRGEYLKEGTKLLGE